MIKRVVLFWSLKCEDLERDDEKACLQNVIKKKTALSILNYMRTSVSLRWVEPNSDRESRTQITCEFKRCGDTEPRKCDDDSNGDVDGPPNQRQMRNSHFIKMGEQEDDTKSACSHLACLLRLGKQTQHQKKEDKTNGKTKTSKN